MKTQGTKILFESRAPIGEEVQDFPHIQTTSKREWNLTKVRTSRVTASAVSIDLYLTDPTESRLKEKMTALVPRYGAEVARFDETSEDLPKSLRSNG